MTSFYPGTNEFVKLSWKISYSLELANHSHIVTSSIITKKIDKTIHYCYQPDVCLLIRLVYAKLNHALISADSDSWVQTDCILL